MSRNNDLPATVAVAGMALGLALFYRGGALPIMLAGLALFGLLALLRPAGGLLFVPLTVPLYLIPVSIPGIRASGFELPLHEVVLLAVLGATAAHELWRWGRAGGRGTGDGRQGDKETRDTRHETRDTRHETRDTRHETRDTR